MKTAFDSNLDEKTIWVLQSFSCFDSVLHKLTSDDIPFGLKNIIYFQSNLLWKSKFSSVRVADKRSNLKIFFPLKYKILRFRLANKFFFFPLVVGYEIQILEEKPIFIRKQSHRKDTQTQQCNSGSQSLYAVEQNTSHSNLSVRPKEFLHVCINMSTKILPRGKVDFLFYKISLLLEKILKFLLVMGGF